MSLTLAYKIIRLIKEFIFRDKEKEEKNNCKKRYFLQT